MTSAIATVAYVGMIGGLFWLDRDRKARTSFSLWIPIVWVALASSRSVSQWLQMQPLINGSSDVTQGSPIDAAVYTGLLALGLTVLFVRWKRIRLLLGANGPIILCFLYCLISLVWSDFPGVAFKRWTKAVGDFVMVLIVLSEHDPTEAIKRVLMRTAYLLIPLSVLFIKYYPELGRVYGEWDYKAYYTGVTTNKNTLGSICMLSGLACVWCLIKVWKNRDEPRRIQRLLGYGIILMFVLWLFDLANSMTSFSTFLLALPVLFFADTRTKRTRTGMIHTLVTAAISVALIAEFVLPSLLTLVNRNPTLTDRTDVWALALSVRDSSLIGAGFESFWLGPRVAKIWSVFRWGPTEAHNGYLEMFLQLGWLGLVFLSVIVASGYKAIIGKWRRNDPTASLMLAFFVVGMIYNLTEAAFFRMMAPVWIILLLAFTRDSSGGVKRLKSATADDRYEAALKPEWELVSRS